MLSFMTTQLCHGSIKTDADKYVNKWVWLCSSKPLFTKTGSGPNLALGWLIAKLQIL